MGKHQPRCRLLDGDMDLDELYVQERSHVSNKLHAFNWLPSLSNLLLCKRAEIMALLMYCSALIFFCSGISTCFGAIVGLVVITPSAGFVTPGAAFCEGIIGAIIIFHIQTFVMPHTHVDDGLECFSNHGCGGMVGFILTACFAYPEVHARL